MKTKDKGECWLVIGVVDSYGAVHCKKIYDFGGDNPTHYDLWPMIQKRWRFKVSDWQIDKSPLSKENLTAEDCEAILSRMRKIVKVPHWVLQGEAWHKAGRPTRDSKAGKKFFEKWEKVS